MVQSMLQPPMRGMVLRAFGAGNAPDQSAEFLAVLKEASDRGVVIVAVTQCPSECGQCRVCLLYPDHVCGCWQRALRLRIMRQVWRFVMLA